jgi:protein-S-isoprenylcysteine O-methyltransferase Ste14
LDRRFFGKEDRMMEKEEKKEGMVRDLAERVKRGELTAEEAKEEVLRMGVHKKYENKYAKSIGFFVITGGLLCFLSFIAKQTGLKVLSFLTQLPSITFPPIVIYGVAAVVIFVNILGMWYAPRVRTKRGGTHWEHGTIILIKDGPYAIMRHPGILAMALWFPMFTIALARGIPFTVLSIIGNILFFIGVYYITVAEDEMNVVKWGDEYRQYKKEVPRYNFILGIWRWAKRKRK